MDELERNNYAELCGTLAAPPALSHENRQERFFTFPLETQRLSGTIDRVNVVVRERLLSALWDVGTRVSLEGRLQSRSYIKVLDTGAVERTAFEVSVLDICRLSPPGD